MHEMDFRLAGPADLEQIFMMGFDVWSEGADQETYLATCRSSPKYARGQWYVLDQEQAPVSALIVYSIDEEHSVFGLGSIATRVPSRKQGYARKLIAAVMAHICEASPEAKFFLYSDIAPEFYARLGFIKLPKALQLYADTECMICPAAALTLLEAKQFSVPKYF